MSAHPITFIATEWSQARSFWRGFRRRRSALLGLVLLAVLVGMAATADLVSPGDPLARSGTPLSAPFVDATMPLGTDPLGHDVLAALFHGARTSLVIGAVATFVAVSIGVLAGALAGFLGGWVDALLMRVGEAVRTVPRAVLVLALVAVFGHSMQTIALAIGFVSWTGTARLMRAELRVLRSREFVDAARNLGTGKAMLLFGEILPNALPPVIAHAPFIMAVSILLESTLAFLGLGDPSRASWGAMLGASPQSLHGAWHCALVPGSAIMLAALSLGLIGEGVKDVLDAQRGRA